MVVTKVTIRKRKKPDWLDGVVHPVFDLTEDGDESESASVSESDFNEDGNESPPNSLASPAFNRKILWDDLEEADLQLSSLAKGSPIANYTRVEVQSSTNTEIHNHIKMVVSQIVLPVESIQPLTQISRLYIKFSAQAVEVLGGDKKENIVYEWPLENIVRIGMCDISDLEEGTRAYVVVRISVPLVPLAGFSQEIDECLLQLSNFRENMYDIKKLSPVFGSIMEELKKEDISKILRTFKIQNSQASISSYSTSSQELVEAVDAFKVLVYPQGDPDAVTITQKDIKILKPSEFLNDTIIDFYIKYLQQTIVSAEKLETLHFFNSFFFSKLAEDGAGGPAAFERVKKWTKKVNIFEKDFIFIPVNQSFHWSLIIICHPGHMWDVPIMNGSSDGDACILHLDSMEGCHKGVDGYIKSYLFQEWIERNPNAMMNADEMTDAEEFFSVMPYKYTKVPQQDNNCDCGLFLLHYVEIFLKTAPPVYRTKRQRNSPTRFLRRNWFKPSEASAKRLVIQKLILELSQGRTLECLPEMEENAPNRVFPADEVVTRALSSPSYDHKRSTGQSTSELGSVHSDPSHPVEEPLIENCAYSRSKEVEPNDGLKRAENPDRQREHVKLQHVHVSTEDRECEDRFRNIYHISSGQRKVSCTSGADQRSAHILVVDDDLKSGREAVILPDGETWKHKKCPVPRLPLQVKPLQVPVLLDKQVYLYSQSSTVSKLGNQDASESSDDPSCSLMNDDPRKFHKNTTGLEFDSILSPEMIRSGTSDNDDEMYESSSFDAQQRCATPNLQPDILSPFVLTLEHGRCASGLSPEFLHEQPDDCFMAEGLGFESGRRPVRFSTKASPSRRCSESNMQGALNCGQRKHAVDRDLARRDSNHSCSSTMYSKEVQEIEELSDDSSDFQRWDPEKKSFQKNAKQSAIETEQRVTRSRTQISHGLTLSTEKETRKLALEALRKGRDSRRK